jgi:hypothetical protein
VCGIIDQVEMAQRLGHNNPVKPMADPPESAIIGNAANQATSSTGGDPASTDGSGDTPPRSDASAQRMAALGEDEDDDE